MLLFNWMPFPICLFRHALSHTHIWHLLAGLIYLIYSYLTMYLSFKFIYCHWCDLKGDYTIEFWELAPICHFIFTELKMCPVLWIEFWLFGIIKLKVCISCEIICNSKNRSRFKEFIILNMMIFFLFSNDICIFGNEFECMKKPWFI